ncbi:MAG: hypothetical protein ABI383_00470, partial [Acidobacteriaceae bacterium]
KVDRWFSPELAVMMKTVTKRKGRPNSTMEMTDVSMGEPDPALFELPPGSVVKDDSANAEKEQTEKAPK